LIPAYIKHLQSIVLGKSFEDHLCGLRAQLCPMKIKLLQGSVSDQKLFQPRCTVVSQIVFGEIQDDKRVDVGKMRKYIANRSVIDIV
jgi:hypothetical protein